MESIKVSIACFGAFRKFGDSLSVDVASGSTIEHLKQALVQKLGDESCALVGDSVFADATSILRDQDTLTSTINLSVLPPVCGG